VCLQALEFNRLKPTSADVFFYLLDAFFSLRQGLLFASQLGFVAAYRFLLHLPPFALGCRWQVGVPLFVARGHVGVGRVAAVDVAWCGVSTHAHACANDKK